MCMMEPAVKLVSQEEASGKLAEICDNLRKAAGTRKLSVLALCGSGLLRFFR